MRVRQSLLAVALLLVLGGGGCAGPAATANGAASGTARAAGLPDWNGPSDAAHLVCTTDAVQDISGALGLVLTEPLAPVFKDHLYSCAYHYPGAVLTLSVKDLADPAATTAWFASLRGAAGPGAAALGGLGEAAFQEADGTVVLRKDDTVLVVDVSALPAQVGKPPRSRAAAARTVATTVLICWKEG
jgi:hypothetical protein